jgi:hypothetical protein
MVGGDDDGRRDRPSIAVGGEARERARREVVSMAAGQVNEERRVSVWPTAIV